MYLGMRTRVGIIFVAAKGDEHARHCFRRDDRVFGALSPLCCVFLVGHGLLQYDIVQELEHRLEALATRPGQRVCLDARAPLVLAAGTTHTSGNPVFTRSGRSRPNSST